MDDIAHVLVLVPPLKERHDRQVDEPARDDERDEESPEPEPPPLRFGRFGHLALRCERSTGSFPGLQAGEAQTETRSCTLSSTSDRSSERDLSRVSPMAVT